MPRHYACIPQFCQRHNSRFSLRQSSPNLRLKHLRTMRFKFRPNALVGRRRKILRDNLQPLREILWL